ncbi:hypothetical protein L6452_18843 [Arctium lappa]|uniref:Uncharacterized protein n=1 Tax=Arctium lappa TaxID=4217 RepID=A0ACB9C7B8_ARCLA|nr:hypothetical protein L6452_18843 [Arctium lappa]
MRHYRSVSMDSIMGKMNFADELLNLSPSPEGRINKLPPSDSVDANSDMFSLEFGNGLPIQRINPLFLSLLSFILSLSLSLRLLPSNIFSF